MMIADHKNIKYLEEISLNAWPSHKSELYDGWIIRYSHNYTYRTNSVQQVGESTIDISEKVKFCENAYRHHGTPATFKINPLMDPSFDEMLEDRGYEVKHVTEVMIGDLDEMHPSNYENVVIQAEITDDWISGLFELNGTTDPLLKKIVPSMFKAIPKKTIVCSIEEGRRMVASGLGICDREYIGIYAIYVTEAYRRKGYARAICSCLLTEGRRQGADKAYLQVVKDNVAAKALYSDLGFTDFYTYWFRSRDV